VQGYDYELARLPHGGTSIKSISLGAQLYSGALFNPTVHWDGKHITVSSYPDGYKSQESGTISVYRLSIAGSRATVIGTTKLSSPKDRNDNPLWIRGATSLVTFITEAKTGLAFGLTRRVANPHTKSRRRKTRLAW
jgi:hypothetical protein